VVGYAPGDPADWDDQADPGHVDGALDQLAERVDDNASAIDLLTNDHGELTGLGDDDHTIYLLADGTRDLAGPLLVDTDKEIRFRTAGQRIYSSGEDALDLDCGTYTHFRVGSHEQLRLTTGLLRFNDGTGGLHLYWGLPNELHFMVSGQTKVKVTGSELYTNERVRGKMFRATAVPSGAANTITYGGSYCGCGMISQASLGGLADVGVPNQKKQAGWITIYVGNSPAAIPFWR
jgi:hypothetical protein